MFENIPGRPTPLYYAENLTKELGGGKIYLKREDLNHTGARKINNVIGQVLLAQGWVKANHSRNGSWTAWSSCSYHLCDDEFRMRNLYG